MLFNPAHDTPEIILIRSLALLREAGWCPQPGDDAGPMCIDQAIRASADIETAYDATALLANHLGYQGIDPSGFIMNWNDKKGRTFADVIGAVECAAAL